MFGCSAQQCSPEVNGRPTDSRTAAREAYFLELAKGLAKSSAVPLMLTGGIDVVGMGTALAVTPDLPKRWLDNLEATDQLKPVTWSDKTLASAASMALVRHQMRRITRGLAPTGRTHPAFALITAADRHANESC